MGLFAPPLLASTAVGAGIGAAAEALAKRHEEEQIGLDADKWLPADSSAIVAVVDDVYLDRVDNRGTSCGRFGVDTARAGDNLGTRYRAVHEMPTGVPPAAGRG